EQAADLVTAPQSDASAPAEAAVIAPAATESAELVVQTQPELAPQAEVAAQATPVALATVQLSAAEAIEQFQAAAVVGEGWSDTPQSSAPQQPTIMIAEQAPPEAASAGAPSSTPLPEPTFGQETERAA